MFILTRSLQIITVTRKFEFDAAHRVLKHESKCLHLHGHRYVAEVTVKAPRLDELGRVVDFNVLKTVIGKWIDDNWDHNILLNSDDPLVQLWKLSKETGFSSLAMDGVVGLAGAVFAGKEPYIFQGENPTAEVMACMLGFHGQQALGALNYDTTFRSPLTVTHVRLHETPNCFADWHLEV